MWVGTSGEQFLNTNAKIILEEIKPGSWRQMLTFGEDFMNNILKRIPCRCRHPELASTPIRLTSIRLTITICKLKEKV
ncbi:hypothetical protein Hamer_G026092 [Homarus americanus]|uniref:Uncharacterized protein n=1 Tax=Homarus americanus TaxID=6706 RepID=A0A8J5K7M9_HOMAM|nr:hypothetical protein Hamer_G026092 [Homarus americanus]